VAEFVPIAQRLRPPAQPAAEPPGEAEPVEAKPGLSLAAVELPLIRLAAREAYARAFERLLNGLARDVLARELAVAPPDLARLMQDALETFEGDEPVSFVTGGGPGRARFGGVPVRVDASLQPGDLLIEVRDGCIDARFAVRLSQAIERALEEFP
jgi:hypothetical protein